MEHASLNTTIDPVAPLTFELQILAGDLQGQWKRCNMVANYIAEYVSYQFTDREWAENLISTVTNEFLEAITSLSPAEAEVKLRCHHRKNDLMIEIEHGLRPDIAPPYAALLTELARGVSDDRYLTRLTANRPLIGFNQLGLTMVAHDFGVHITGRVNSKRNTASIKLIVPIRVPTA